MVKVEILEATVLGVAPGRRHAIPATVASRGRGGLRESRRQRRLEVEEESGGGKWRMEERLLWLCVL